MEVVILGIHANTFQSGVTNTYLQYIEAGLQLLGIQRASTISVNLDKVFD